MSEEYIQRPCSCGEIKVAVERVTNLPLSGPKLGRDPNGFVIHSLTRCEEVQGFGPRAPGAYRLTEKIGGAHEQADLG